MEANENLEVKPFEVTPELQAALDSAVASVEARPSGQRHPFGKMINCPHCGTRHREVGQTTFIERRDSNGVKTTTVEQVTTRCVQNFTFKMKSAEGDLMLLKDIEDENGETKTVPAYRAFGTDGERPTQNQVVGAPRKNGFSANRIKKHPSKMKLLFIERTREAFVDLGFDIMETDQATFGKNLEEARQEAARRIRADHKASKQFKRFVAEHSLRINRGLENNGSRYVNRDRTIPYKAERITR